MCCSDESTCEIVGTFRAPPVIRHCASSVPLVMHLVRSSYSDLEPRSAIFSFKSSSSVVGNESTYVNLFLLTGKGMDFLPHLLESPHFPPLLVKFLSEALTARAHAGFIRIPHFPALLQKWNASYPPACGRQRNIIC